MTDLRELYQQVILDHYRNPRNQATVEPASARADGHNPLCGDKVHVTLALDGDVIQAIGFEGAGCAISTASASLMTEAVKGRTVEEAEVLFGRFQRLVKGEADDQETDDLGKLEVLAGVRDYPVRIKCATLAWHTLQAALDARCASDEPVAVTTET